MRFVIKFCCLMLVGTAGLVLSSSGAEPVSLYRNDFEKAAPGSVPEDFLVLDGGFTVREESGNRFLELPGAPLDTFGVLFGPTGSENILVSARVFGTAKGRRFPTFAVGLGGQAGYRLQIAPAKKRMELYKGEMLRTSVPFEWASGKWTGLVLQVRKTAPGQWQAEGKAWAEGSPEPKTWMITAEESKEPGSGRASIWGCPFSGTAIRFDNFLVARVTE